MNFFPHFDFPGEDILVESSFKMLRVYRVKHANNPTEQRFSYVENGNKTNFFLNLTIK